MFFQTGSLSETFLTLTASVWLFTRVNYCMSEKLAVAGEGFVTQITDVRLPALFWFPGKVLIRRSSDLIYELQVLFELEKRIYLIEWIGLWYQGSFLVMGGVHTVL